MKKQIQLTILLLFVCLIALPAKAKEYNTDILNQIETKFLADSVPIRYFSNILIRLEGQPTAEDSMIIAELVDTLNSLIDVWDVYLIYEGTSNLVIQINKPENEGEENHIEENQNGREIIQNIMMIR